MAARTPRPDSAPSFPSARPPVSLTELPTAIFGLGYASACGLLIGLERGWSQREGSQGSRIAGIRTFTLLGLAGGIAALAPAMLGMILLGMLGLSLVASYHRFAGAPDQRSVTATIAGLVTLGLGVLAPSAPDEAIAGAAITVVVLASREPLHRWLRGLREPEIRAGARFAVIAFVLLPLAPDAAFGPYGAWNPHELWLVVVFVSGLSFLGYVFHAREAGRRGVIISALAAAVVSSTVATATLARRLDRTTRLSPFASAIIAANVVMLARILGIVAVLVPSILLPISLLLAPALVVSAGGALLGLRANLDGSGREGEAAIPVGNPLDLGAAVGLAIIVATASLIGHWILARFGNLALGVVLALIGLFDADAAIFTVAGLPPNRIAPLSAAAALAIPVLLNMVAKAVLTVWLAPHRGGLRPAVWLLAGAGASGAMLMAVL
ncbi:hypothetical protein HY78_07680 [Rhizorhabdus wittichii DC-6]|nr:hypothetical protein HY78_07680 [Rhizorhabdus wittichii DC-6]